MLLLLSFERQDIVSQPVQVITVAILSVGARSFAFEPQKGECYTVRGVVL
jgi:hypothetical protein